MMPPAPGRLSTTTCWPQRSESFWATQRAAISEVLPGEPAMKRTGREGYLSASAACAPAATSAARTAPVRVRSMSVSVRSSGKSRRRSVDLRAGGDQHLRELLDLGADEGVELFGRR